MRRPIWSERAHSPRPRMFCGTAINAGSASFSQSVRTGADCITVVVVVASRVSAAIWRRIEQCEGVLAGLPSSRAIVAFVHDLVVVAASVGGALYLRLGDSMFALSPDVAWYMLALCVSIACVIFPLLGMYRGIWRYASIEDLLNITKGATLVVLLFLPLMFILNRMEEIPRSVPFIQWCLLIVALGGSRFAYRLLRHHALLRVDSGAPTVPVLLLGAGDAADLFIRVSRSDPHAPYRVVGLLDDAGGFQGRQIQGIPVLGRLRDLPVVVARLARQGIHLQRVILTDPAMIEDATKRHLVEQAGELQLNVTRLPRLTELQDAAEDRKIHLQPVALQDLVGRAQFASDRTTVDRLIGGRRVLITGAGGTIGSELARQIANLGPSKIILLDISEFNLYAIDLELRERQERLQLCPLLCNIRDRERVMAIFAAERPELVFHAAALKHVPMVEMNPGEGILTNVAGTRNVADAAAHYRARAMVQVSTDKAVKPTSVMGASKRLAEFYCQSLDLAGDHDDRSARFMTVRFGNVLGSSGSVLPLFQRQLARGGPLTVTHPEITRYFMSVQEAVALVLQASAHGLEVGTARGQIFVLDMGNPAKIVDIARQVIRLAGLRPDVDVKIVFTGLRPGEKLYEELFDDGEERLDGWLDGIFVALSKSINLEVLRRLSDELALAAQQHDRTTLLRLLAHGVPSYQHAEVSAERVFRSAGGRMTVAAN
jgi:FlaA1/EpsC-like NDP-sugar epimerase